MRTNHWFISHKMTPNILQSRQKKKSRYSTGPAAYVLKIWAVSSDTDIDMRLCSALTLPQACWDWRNWSVAFSSPGRRCQSGCWMTTWTPRHCWRRSAMTKWRPSSLTPMRPSPILSWRRSALTRARSGAAHAGPRVRLLCSRRGKRFWDLHFSLSCAHLGNLGCSHEGHTELNICKIIKQLPQSPRGFTFVVITQCCFFFFNLLCPWEQHKEWYFMSPSNSQLNSKKVFLTKKVSIFFFSFFLRGGADVIHLVQGFSNSWCGLQRP